MKIFQYHVFKFKNNEIAEQNRTEICNQSKVSNKIMLVNQYGDARYRASKID